MVLRLRTPNLLYVPSGSARFNPRIITTNAALYNDGLSVHAEGQTGSWGRTRTEYGSSGKFYYEVTNISDEVALYSAGTFIGGPLSTLADGTGDAGIPNLAISPGLAGDVYTGSNGYFSAWTSGYPGADFKKRMCVAVDAGTRKMWVRIDNAAWNPTVGGTQNPATGEGGIDFSAALGFTTAGQFLRVGASAQWGRRIKFSFDPSSWAYDAPSEFGPIGPPPATWNPLDKGSQVDVSNDDRTITRRGSYTNAYNTIRSYATVMDKTYYEVRIDSGFTDAGDYSIGVGFADNTFTLEGAGTYLGNAGNTSVAAWSPGDDIYWNTGVTTAWNGGGNIPANGDIFCVAYDPDAKLFWAKEGGGLWNFSATANPANGSGGQSVAGLPSIVHAAISIKNGGTGVVTARFREEEWTYTAPEGYVEIGKLNPLPPVTWDAYNSGDSITYTNGFLTAERNNASSEDLSTSRSTLPLLDGYDYYWEIFVDTQTNGNFVIGVVTSTKDLDDWVASGTSDGIGVNPAGNYYLNGSNQGAWIDTWTTGDIICVHCKRSDNTIRWRKNNGTWTSFVTCTWFEGSTLYAATNGGILGNEYSGRFASASWTYAAPSGAIEIGGNAFYQQTDTFAEGSANGFVIAPEGAIAVRVQTWGAGGGGNGNGYGSGGGAYAESLLPATSNTIVYYTVGAGGPGNSNTSAGIDGGDTWARLDTNSAPTSNSHGALAAGGMGGYFSGGGYGLGGAVADCIGTIRFKGGDVDHTPTWEGAGGGAGERGAGGDSSNTGIGGIGGEFNGGCGGRAIDKSQHGQPPGGGGASAITAGVGGNGGDGRVSITYYYSPLPPPEPLVNSLINDLVRFARITPPSHLKVVSIPNPVANDSITAFWTNTAIHIKEVRSVLKGNTSPSVNFTIASGPRRDGVGNTIMQANVACSNLTTGNTLTTFSNTTIAANSFVWVNVLSTAGNVDELHISLRF